MATVVLQSGHGELPFHLKGAVREGERQRGGWAGTEGCRGHGGQGRAGTHPILQQLLGVVDGADDAGPAAASTAMTARGTGWALSVLTGVFGGAPQPPVTLPSHTHPADPQDAAASAHAVLCAQGWEAQLMP